MRNALQNEFVSQAGTQIANGFIHDSSEMLRSVLQKAEMCHTGESPSKPKVRVRLGGEGTEQEIAMQTVPYLLQLSSQCCYRMVGA